MAMDNDNAIERVLTLFQCDKTLQAAALLDELQSHMTPAQRADAEHQQPILKQLREEAAESNAILTQLKEDTDWTLSYDGKVTKVWYKPPGHGDNGLATFKIESRLVCNVHHLACTVYEVDLYADILWYIKTYEELRAESKCRRALYLRTKFVWPLADREFYCYAYAVDALDEHDGILIVLKDLESRPDRCTGFEDRMHNKAKDAVRGGMMFTTMFVAESASVTRFTALVKVDPAMAVIPPPLINFIGKNFGAAIPKMFQTKANNLTDEHKRRLETGDIYKWYRGRMVDFWTRKGDHEALRQLQQGIVDSDQRLSGDFDIATARKGPGRAAALALLKKN